jgi:hypothetical protein
MALRATFELTEDETRKILADWRGFAVSSFWNELQECLHDPRPHVVNYRTNHFYYHAPHHVPILPRQRGPNDCTWIVPGTLERDT